MGDRIREPETRSVKPLAQHLALSRSSTDSSYYLYLFLGHRSLSTTIKVLGGSVDWRLFHLLSSLVF